MKNRWISISLMSLVGLYAKCEASSFARGVQNQWYGTSGVANSGLPIASYTVNAALVDQQNRTYLVGIKTGVGSLVVRLTSMGVLDTSYANGVGYVTFQAVSATEQLYGVAFDTSGNLYVCGGDGTDSFAAKLLPSGVLDSSWGDNNSGKVVADFEGWDYAYSIAVRSNGRAVLCGQATGTQFFLIQLLPSGAVDSSFTNGERAIFRNGGYCNARALALQTDGKIVVAVAFSDNAASRVYRFTTTGGTDSSFGGGTGYATLGGADVSLYSLVIQDSGRIVTAGEFHRGGGFNDVYLYGLDSTGELDATFGGGDGISPILIKASVPLVPRGLLTDVYSRLMTAINANNSTVEVYGFSSNGVLDTSFAQSGYLQVNNLYQGFTQDYLGNLVLAYKGDVNQSISLYANYNSSLIGVSASSGPTLAATGVANRFTLVRKPIYQTIISASEQAGMSQQELSFNSGL